MGIQLPRPISRIRFSCSDETKTALRSKLPIQEGSILSDELLQQSRNAANAHDEALTVLVRQSLRQELFEKASPEARQAFVPPDNDEGVTVVIWDRRCPPQRIRVEGSDQSGQLIEKTMPDFGGELPGSGPVNLSIVVGKDGTVTEALPLAGPESLFAPSVDAVRQWKYKPTLLNGRPVEIETTVTLTP